MANGTTREAIARADRIRERAKQGKQASANAIANLRRTQLASITDEDEVSEVTGSLGDKKLSVRGIPRWSLGLAIVLLAIPAGVLVLVLALRIAKVAGLIH